MGQAGHAAGVDDREPARVGVAGSVAVERSVGVVGSNAAAGSVGVVGSVATAGSVGVVGSAATAGSAGVVGSAGTSGSAGVVGSVARHRQRAQPAVGGARRVRGQPGLRAVSTLPVLHRVRRLRRLCVLRRLCRPAGCGAAGAGGRVGLAGGRPRPVIVGSAQLRSLLAGLCAEPVIMARVGGVRWGGRGRRRGVRGWRGLWGRGRARLWGAGSRGGRWRAAGVVGPGQGAEPKGQGATSARVIGVVFALSQASVRWARAAASGPQ